MQTIVASPAPGAEQKHSLTQFGTYFGLLAQLAVLLVIVERFQVENEAFFRLTALTVAGFAIHYLLPYRHRLPFFVLLSWAGIAMVLGVAQGAWLVGIGIGLIGIAHLPAPLWVRVGLLLAVGGALALQRRGLGTVPWSAAIWPILGSMFVFRLLSYLYDRHHGVAPTRLSQTLAYFFLLPNVCFPLFPLIDFKRFCRGYYDDERHRIYQVGVEWIWRGVIQLIIYRLVYFHLTLDPVEVANVADLFVYVFSTFLLYVRLSGYFHIVVGMLHLFGFNLPETHHRYFLASSFTDFWRRINIYWKDFMMKVVYYPAFFRLRKQGETRALVLGTILTFVVTWFLHMVQWFWIRGSILVEWNDIIFWSLFAALVLVNSLYETKHGRARTLQKRERTLGESTGLVVRTVGTFATICVMWSFWSAESATDWWLMVTGALALPPWSLVQAVSIIAAAAVALSIAIYGVWRGGSTGPRALGPPVAPRAVFATSLAMYAVTLPAFTEPLGASSEVIASLQLKSASARNRRYVEDFQRGYYENLLEVSRFNSELQRMYEQMPADFVRSLSRLGLSRPTGDEQDYELVPLKEGRFVGATVRTNRWGMRDDDYTLEPRPNTYRMALLGPSTAMASGVEAHQGFEAILEERLNRDAGSGARYEILNFGVAAYAPLHMLYQLEAKVFPFNPDAALFLGHASDLERTATQWVRLLQKGVMPGEEYFEELTRRTGITAETQPTEARRRMKPYTRELLGWVYSRFAARCREHGVTPVFIYMETVTEPAEAWRAGQRLEVIDLARAAGFEIVDLTGAYGGHAQEELWIAQNDGHPNVLGNRLIAERLYNLLRIPTARRVDPLETVARN